jgi:hypothetical protein
VGGMLSGRWGWHTKRPTVEESRMLDLSKLKRDGAFRPGCSGHVRWLRGETETSSIGYTVGQQDCGLILTLHYKITRTGEDVKIPVRLDTTRPRFGGLRWWFICPLTVNGRPCTRRVGKLYLPPGARYFGCRHCHGLTYTSCQESHKYDKLFRFLAQDTGYDLATVKWAMNRIGTRNGDRL